MHVLQMDTVRDAECLTLSFGQFLVFITGIKECHSCMPSQWMDYAVIEKDRKADAILHVCENSNLYAFSVNRHKEGWNYHFCNNDRYAIYVFKGIPLFALQYGLSVQELIIHVKKGSEISFRFGIQFGVITALNPYCVGLHGVTLLCGSEIMILSAPSGTGKTTLSYLLEKYCDALVINGDFALLSFTEKGIIFEPVPFCGTSRRCLNHRVLVNRVIFLAQAKENQWKTLSGRKAVLQLINNSFVPTWDQHLRNMVELNIVKCAAGLKVNEFSFVPDQTAAEMLYQQCCRET